MKYACEIEVNKPVDEVVELFDNQKNLYKWMDELKSIEHLEGEPGKPGAKTKMIFNMRNKDVEMIETIKVKNLPDELSGTYEANGVFNIQKNRFEKIDENKTRYITENEFQFKGAMKLMGLAKGPFKKQSMKYLESFKKFAEEQN